MKEPSGTAVHDDDQFLSTYFQDEKTLVFKDLGVQLSWRLVYVIEYAGPLLICPLLFMFPAVFYGVEYPVGHHQLLCMCLILLHFSKRVLESLFVHRFSSATMPFGNLFVNCGYYWVLNGAGIGYFLLHPLYSEPKYSELVKNALLFGFFISEVMNGCCHLVQRNLRRPGTKERGIPRGFGFDYVSCANYFWEICAWLCFAVLAHCVTSYVFLAATFWVLRNWAKSRHRRYLKEFDGKEGRQVYPMNRKALIPFLI